MTAPAERQVEVNGHPCRVWEKGRGEPLGFLPGFGGLPRWPAFLDRLAEERRVIAPSLPGFPGGEGHDALDDLPDWIAATLDLLEASELAGADLVAASVGGSWPRRWRRSRARPSGVSPCWHPSASSRRTSPSPTYSPG